MSTWLTIATISVAVVGLASTLAFLYFSSVSEEVMFDLQSSMDLVEVPVVTLRANGQTGKKMNFMLDTGCNICMIDSDYVYMLDTSKAVREDATKDAEPINTAGGDVKVDDTVAFKLSWREYSFDIVADVAYISSFRYIEKECGVKIHGILGTDFLSKYDFILDFEKNVVFKRIKLKKK